MLGEENLFSINSRADSVYGLPCTLRVSIPSWWMNGLVSSFKSTIHNFLSRTFSGKQRKATQMSNVHRFSIFQEASFYSIETLVILQGSLPLPTNMHIILFAFLLFTQASIINPILVALWSRQSHIGHQLLLLCMDAITESLNNPPILWLLLLRVATTASLMPELQQIMCIYSSDEWTDSFCLWKFT